MFRRLLFITVGAFVAFSASAQRLTDELSALREENRRLKTENEAMQRRLSLLEGGPVQDYWSDLSGLESNDETFHEVGEGSVKAPSEDDILAAKLRLAAPELIIPFQEEQRDYVRFYSQTKARAMKVILTRFDRYRAIFEEIFRRYGIPEDLAALCIVESAVSQNALSTAGALGMWQLMPGTARDYGLTVDGVQDDRLDITLSTEAAAKHLAFLFRTFGDWRLAILSYNGGPGAVRRAIIRNGGRQDFWSVYEFLPKETQGYLLSLIAVRYVIENRGVLDSF